MTHEYYSISFKATGLNFGNGLLDDIRQNLSTERHSYRPGPFDVHSLI